MIVPRPAPCRLFVYLARDAPVAAVLRRGPSDWARLSRWRTDSDTFEHGQWIKGRVYERRSDLSANGELFLAFVRQSGGNGDLGVDTWLAISRLPWFTALALWKVGGTYHTGGFFPGPGRIWTGYGAAEPDRGTLPRWLRIAEARPPLIDGTTNWTERTVWTNRLLRDGWRRIEAAKPETWERESPRNELLLTMRLRSEADFAAYGGPHVVEYAVADPTTGEATQLGRCDWADWDHRGRLIVARDGRLDHWRGPDDIATLADLTPQTPVPEAAPDSARVWPRAPGRQRSLSQPKGSDRPDAER